MSASVVSKSLITFLILLVTVAWKTFKYLRYHSLLQRHGCSPVAQYPHEDSFLGYDLYRIIEKSRQQNNAVRTLQWLFRTFGNGKTFQALTWGIPTVYSADPRNIQAVLQERFHDFGVEPFRKPFNDPWIRTGLLVSDGQKWKMSRTVLRPLFKKSQHADLPGLEMHVQRLLAMIPEDDATSDIQPILCQLVSLRSISCMNLYERDD